MFRTRPCLAALAGALATLAVTAGCGGGGAPSPSPSDADAARRTARTAFDATCSMDAPGFGAHLSHSGNAVRGPISCLECHAPCAPAPAQKVAFGELASADGATPLWSEADRTCTGVYCHGATGVTPTAPMTWTYADPDRPRPPGELCGTCHGYPPPPPHGTSTACNSCHPQSVKADGTVDLAGGHHVDGVLDVSCTACHSFPPQTGAHVAHAGPPVDAAEPPLDYATLQDRYPGASPVEAPAHYAFGCGTCHSLDPALHHDGKIDIVLAPTDGPAGSLKARNAPDAAYDAASGRCAGVYCHSTGQEYPAYAVTPAWTSGERPGCTGCHANPPAYASGGAGAPDANSHVNLADDGWEFGHFLGVPGVWHSNKHGFQGAAPITCQSCHYDTVDPANVAPGGFYYLDTTGTYALPGGDPGRLGTDWAAQLDCTSCHTGATGAPPRGTGRVLPLRHVNGTRDVVFDPRAALPSLAWLPPAPNTPVKAYWTAEAITYYEWGPTAVVSGSTVSFELGVTRYDPSTKTCSGAACHLADVPVWGKPYGFGGPNWENCNLCHPGF